MADCRSSRRKTPTKPSLFIVLGAALVAALLITPAWADSPADQRTPAEVIASVQVIHAPGAGVETELTALKVALDPETGKLRPLTAEESRKLGEQEKNLRTGRSIAPLKAIEMEDGGVRLDLQGRFLSLSTAEQAEDGSLSGQCVESVDKAFAAATGEEVHLDH
ncbi:MAG: hypothetical protein AAF481_12850 [Acidobacteriota bacterium]